MRITDLTALALGRQIRSGEITAMDAVNALYDAVGEDSLNAYITLQPREEVLVKAAEIQAKIIAGELASPLAGVPVALKDNICSTSMRTTCASKMMGDYLSPIDAAVVERLGEAGALVAGKLNMDEFALGATGESSFFGPVKNPWNTGYVAGGSSGGGAAAVAARAAFCALGSDTGGSVRVPASFCGVSGFKPSYGAASRYGLVACGSSLDQIGPIARDVADITALMDAIKGKDKRDAMSLDLPGSWLDSLTGSIAGKRIACFADNNECVLAAAETLRGLGAVIEWIELPMAEAIIPAYKIICAAEASSNLARFDGIKLGHRAEHADNINELYCNNRGEGFGDEVVKRILLGTLAVSSGWYDDYYKKATQVRTLIREAYEKIFADFDAILCPTAPYTAPKLGAEPNAVNADSFTAAANLAGLPALSLPCGFAQGLPVGLQLIGPRLGDADLLNIGYAYQQATDWHKSIPGGVI